MAPLPFRTSTMTFISFPKKAELRV